MLNENHTFNLRLFKYNCLCTAAFCHMLRVEEFKMFFVSLLLFSAVKGKKPGLLAPVIPLGFVFAYQMDSAYGTLIYRMRGKTTQLSPLLSLPQ